MITIIVIVLLTEESQQQLRGWILEGRSVLWITLVVMFSWCGRYVFETYSEQRIIRKNMTETSKEASEL